MTQEERERKEAEVREVLARSRKLVAESRALMEQVELRRVETDRFLASQGLTREQALKLRFTREHRLAANEELRRLGLPQIEEDERAYDFAAATEELRDGGSAVSADVSEDVVEDRRRKLGAFMQEVRL